ncbi:hypothetical protein [Methylibium petroleiphilum]
MLPGEIKDQGPARGGLVAAQARGASARARWIKEGLVVPGPQLAQAWGIRLETLAAATASGEVVSIAIDGSEYFPKALLSLDRLTAGVICRALRQLQDIEKLLFWLRDHGALGGRSVAAALEDGTPTAKVTALAKAWARERTDAGGPER